MKTNNGSSSSSTEDYEVPDIELLNRKKKSGFRLAIERVQQSFRRQVKKDAGFSGRHSAGPSVSSARWLKTDVPLPAPPSDETQEEEDDRGVGGLSCNESDKIKTNSSGSPRIEELAEGSQEGHRGERKSPLPWTKRAARDDDRTKDNGGIFDGILRQFRKGSAKLRGKGIRGI